MSIFPLIKSTQRVHSPTYPHDDKKAFRTWLWICS